jgi:hypothetical protein
MANATWHFRLIFFRMFALVLERKMRDNKPKKGETMGLRTRVSVRFSSEARFTRKINKQLKNDGAEGAAQRIATIINDEVHSRDLALQFVLKEIKRIHREGRYRIIFTRNHLADEASDTETILYQEDAESIRAIQSILDVFTDALGEEEFVAELRAKVIGHVIRKWRIGLYTMEAITVASA